MNFKQFGVLLSVSAVLGMNFIATKALTQEKPSIQFGEAIAEGGCTVASQLTGTDGRTLLIVFDNMHAEDGSRQTCLLRVNTTISSGFQAKNVTVLYQGSTEVPKGSKGTSLSRSYIFNGGALGQATAEPATTNFTSSNSLFQVEDPITVASASCGGEGQLGINIIAQSSPGTSIVIDTNAEIHFELAPC